MSCSPALKWLVGILLIASLGSKWAVSAYVPPDTNEREEQVVERQVVRFLVGNHFNIVGSREVVFGMRVLDVAVGLCRMRVVLSASRGWHRDLIERMSQPDDRTFVVFKGKIYAEQPMLLTISDFLLSKFLLRLGFGVNPSPVITVLAKPTCEADRLSWKDLH